MLRSWNVQLPSQVAFHVLYLKWRYYVMGFKGGYFLSGHEILPIRPCL